MVEDIKKIESDINGLTESLSLLEQEYERGEIDIGRYLKMQRWNLKQKGLAIENLNDILRKKGAGALADVVADVVAELPTSRDDPGLRTDLERVAREGESKGWGTIVQETIKQEKEPIVKTILKAAIKVAVFLGRVL